MTRRMWLFLVVLCVSVLPLSGCVMGEAQTQAALKPFLNADDDRFARKQIDEFVTGHLDAVYNNLDASIQKAETKQTLAAAHKMVPEGGIEQTTLVGVSFNNHVALTGGGPSQRLSILTYQLQFVSGFLLFETAVQTVGGKTTLAGFNVRPLKASLHELNEVRLSSDGVLLGALALLFGGASLVFSLGVAARCVRSTRPRKWLWALYALTGVVAITVDWSTGVYTIQPLQIHAPVFSFMKTYYTPLVLVVFLPVGAIHAHLKETRG